MAKISLGMFFILGICLVQTERACADEELPRIERYPCTISRRSDIPLGARSCYEINDATIIAQLCNGHICKSKKSLVKKDAFFSCGDEDPTSPGYATNDQLRYTLYSSNNFPRAEIVRPVLSLPGKAVQTHINQKVQAKQTARSSNKSGNDLNYILKDKPAMNSNQHMVIEGNVGPYDDFRRSAAIYSNSSGLLSGRVEASAEIQNGRALEMGVVRMAYSQTDIENIASRFGECLTEEEVPVKPSK